MKRVLVNVMTTVTSAVIGIVLWLELLGKGKDAPDPGGGWGAYFVVILVLVLVASFLLPIRPEAVAGGLVLPAVISAVWTTPRGDGDGLWVLVFPYLWFVGCLACGIGYGGRAIRRARQR